MTEINNKQSCLPLPVRCKREVELSDWVNSRPKAGSCDRCNLKLTALSCRGAAPSWRVNVVIPVESGSDALGFTTPYASLSLHAGPEASSCSVACAPGFPIQTSAQ